VPVPGDTFLEVLVLPAGTTESAEVGELACEILLEPAADLVAELLVLGSQLHRASTPYWARLTYCGPKKGHSSQLTPLAATRGGLLPSGHAVFTWTSQLLAYARATIARASDDAGGYLEGRRYLRILRASKIRLGVLSALTAAVTIGALGGVAPAQASLSGHDWTEVSLAARYSFPSISPVSCVQGQQFCVAITTDSRVIDTGDEVGQAALVTTNGGKAWKGYATLPSTMQVLAISCPSSSVCWTAGLSWVTGEAAVAETTDGGKTWTDMTPASWATATWWATAIDCVSATTCWLAGQNSPPPYYGNNPAVASTTDGGATWTVYSNIPEATGTKPLGSYSLSGISCVSALSCVAVGGLDYPDVGNADVISTADGGDTWSMSTDPTLTGLQELTSASCLPPASAADSPTCYATGVTVADVPAVVVSQDGGSTWGGLQTFGNTGWLNSISCINATHCWAAGAGDTSVGLVGTSTGGSTWQTVTADPANETIGSVSCLNVNVCVATTDSGLWVTSDDGGLG
jgi:photosystem II stability/assembly factor-like uncharacterized protein